MIVDHRIAGTRISVWDVLHHLENHWPTDEIADVLGISEEQVREAVEYIQAHRDEVMQVHRRIEQRNAQGNPPDVQARLDAARTRRSAWLEQQRKTVAR